METKLNKNQKEFFENAIKFFGKKSNSVRYKDLSEFTEKNSLILPTTILKTICQEEGSRGKYNLLLSGVSPKKEASSSYNTDDFKNEESIILEKSVFSIVR